MASHSRPVPSCSARHFAFTLIEVPFDRFRAVRQRRRAAFTLIELLVVIAIIALLASILLPSLVRAKRLAETVKCATQFHGFGRASHLYATEHDDWMPRNDYDWGGDHHMFWAICFAPYLEDHLSWQEIDDLDFINEWVTRVGFFHCPGIKDSKIGVDYTVNNIDWDWYHAHKNSDRPYRENPNMGPISKITDIHDPSDVLYLCEASNRFGIRTADIQTDSHTIFDRHGNPAGSRMIKHTDMRHNGKTAFVCFDSHVETHEMVPENFPMRLYVPNHD